MKRCTKPKKRDEIRSGTGDLRRSEERGNRLPIDLLIATTNAGKLKEIRKILSHFRLHSLDSRKITRRAPETGDSFAANARQKAIFYSRLCPRFPVCAEDSGLEVAVLNGLPGVHSARFNREHPGDRNNILKLLDMLKDQPERRARFVTVLALCWRETIIREFTGTVEGLILTRPLGSGGFGYDPVFYYPPLKKTFAQLPLHVKNRVSHRRRAFEQLKSYLDRQYEMES